MEETSFRTYSILKIQDDQNISDFSKIMAKLYGENISLNKENIEGYKFKNIDFFIDSEDGRYSVRMFGDEQSRRNLVSKLENTTGFVLNEIS